MVLAALTASASLLQGCVIGAAIVGAHAYSNYETRKSLGKTVTAYEEAAQSVQIGDSKQRVLALLEPTQSPLKAKLRREPHRYERRGAAIEIHYFRSGWYVDGKTTDDEFTPYVFKDGKLVSIGWRTLTGSRTWARVK
jgi:hypothetical protein